METPELGASGDPPPPTPADEGTGFQIADGEKARPIRSTPFGDVVTQPNPCETRQAVARSPQTSQEWLSAYVHFDSTVVDSGPRAETLGSCAANAIDLTGDSSEDDDGAWDDAEALDGDEAWDDYVWDDDHVFLDKKSPKAGPFSQSGSSLFKFSTLISENKTLCGTTPRDMKGSIRQHKLSFLIELNASVIDLTADDEVDETPTSEQVWEPDDGFIMISLQSSEPGQAKDWRRFLRPRPVTISRSHMTKKGRESRLDPISWSHMTKKERKKAKKEAIETGSDIYELDIGHRHLTFWKNKCFDELGIQPQLTEVKRLNVESVKIERVFAEKYIRAYPDKPGTHTSTRLAKHVHIRPALTALRRAYEEHTPLRHDPTRLVLWTDGSRDSFAIAYRYALPCTKSWSSWRARGIKAVGKGGSALPGHLGSMDMEALAVWQALDMAYRKVLKEPGRFLTITIWSDAASVLHWLKFESSKGHTRCILGKAKKIQSLGLSVEFYWCPGHSKVCFHLLCTAKCSRGLPLTNQQVPGNELADRMATQARFYHPRTGKYVQVSFDEDCAWEDEDEDDATRRLLATSKKRPASNKPPVQRKHLVLSKQPAPSMAPASYMIPALSMVPVRKMSPRLSLLAAPNTVPAANMVTAPREIPGLSILAALDKSLAEHATAGSECRPLEPTIAPRSPHLRRGGSPICRIRLSITSRLTRFSLL